MELGQKEGRVRELLVRGARSCRVREWRKSEEAANLIEHLDMQTVFSFSWAVEGEMALKFCRAERGMNEEENG